MDKALQEIAAVTRFAHDRIELGRWTNADFEFVIRKYKVMLAGIAHDLDTLASCLATNTPVDGINLIMVKDNK